MIGRPFEAKYAGSCALDCGRRIVPGDLIQFNDDGQVVHSSCEDSVEQPAPKQHRNERMCGTCNMIHSGSCF